jgi:hypothetical protein
MARSFDERISRIKRLADLQDEMMLAITILRYARSGHATRLMVEQAIELIEQGVALADELQDVGMGNTARRVVADLKDALRDGIDTLRGPPPPSQEKLKVEDPLANARRIAGHRVRQQLRCAGGIIDIYDLTADELIECKYRGSAAALAQAAEQLQRYRRSFPGAAMTIAVLTIETDGEWIAEVLRREGITIIEMEGIKP